MEKVLPFEAALAEVMTHARSITPVQNDEYLPLLECTDRVLALDYLADRDQPPFPRATRDGYALFSGDEAWGVRPFKVVGSVRAGDFWKGAGLGAAEAVEIMTGAPVPEGADAVLMVEHATLDADQFLSPAAGRTLHPGENVVQQGAEVRAYGPVLRRGCLIGPAEIAVAASCGAAYLGVFQKPRVAIVATGDELVGLDQTPETWQIRNSNSYALAALVHAEGGEPKRLEIARDNVADLRERIADGHESDLLLLSGGVSMGKYDLVEQVLREEGAEFIFTGALIQPGKPVVFGRLPRRSDSADERGWTYFFGLPGNPVSTQVCFHLFVAPLLRTLAGRADTASQFAEARLLEDVKGGARVTRFLPAELSGGWDGVFVRVVAWQGSGDVTANARGNCYAVLPADVPAFRAGDTVRVLLR